MRNDLPTGVVTFMFTDIEGSTILLNELSEEYANLIDEQNTAFRGIFSKYGGKVVDTQGDAYFVAFTDSLEAVKAAVDLQRYTQKETFLKKYKRQGIDAEGINLKIRIGLHTGDVMLTEVGYIGINVHKTARICSAGYGNQILVSAETMEAVKDKLPTNVTLKDLGLHKLKDLARHEKIFQIDVEGLRTEFPSLKSLDSHPNNLPSHLSSFIGREKELGDIEDQLKGVRILTIAGSGGSGKTRLAVKIGEDVLETYYDGVFFVDLSNLRDGQFLPNTIGQALKLREEPGVPMEKTLTNYLERKEMLLILDNCEQVVDVVANLTKSLLSSCKKLKILATSREILNITGEGVFRVPPMSTPEASAQIPLDNLIKYEAIRLFVERATTAFQTFQLTKDNKDSVIAICRRLDGIPLAIELAAARVKVFSPKQIEEKLNERFKILTSTLRDVPNRQQTLQATIDWSYNLLTEKEKLLFRRLSVFAGGWTLEAAQKICADGSDILESETLK